MAYRVGQELYFWNWRMRCLDKLVVTALSSDGIGFQFRYRGEFKKCTYEYARGRLHTSPHYIPEYRRMLKSEAEYREKQLELQREREAQTERERQAREQSLKKSREPIVPSCDNCFRRWSGECTLVRSSLCDDYKAGPVTDYSSQGPTGDIRDYRPIWR